MARRSPRLTKRERKAKASTDEFVERARAEAERQGLRVTLEGARGERETMGDVLKRFGAWVLDPIDAGDLELYRRMFLVVCAAWNHAMTSEAKPEEVADEILAPFERSNSRDREQTRKVVAALVESKRERFASDRRVVMHAEVTGEGGARVIKVASHDLGPVGAEPASADST